MANGGAGLEVEITRIDRDASLKLKGGTAGDIDHAGGAQRTARLEVEDAGVDGGAPGVAAAACEGQGAGAVFDEAAVAGDGAGVGRASAVAADGQTVRAEGDGAADAATA